jgi:hypothetical protein
MLANAAAQVLLSKAEQILYGRLVRAFPGHIVLSKVALSRLASSAPSDGVADFVLCRADFTALAVLAIDAAQADRRGDRHLQAAGVKVIHLPGGDIPHERALRALVATLPLGCSTEQLAHRAS